MSGERMVPITHGDVSRLHCSDGPERREALARLSSAFNDAAPASDPRFAQIRDLLRPYTSAHVPGSKIGQALGIASAAAAGEQATCPACSRAIAEHGSDERKRCHDACSGYQRQTAAERGDDG